MSKMVGPKMDRYLIADSFRSKAGYYW